MSYIGGWNDMVLPSRLQQGDMVGLVCPASPTTVDRVLACKAFVEGMGYQVKLGRSCFESFHGYLAGKKEQRAKDINQMFADPKVKAIFCIRGGYGSSQLMELLDYEMIARNPKIFVGYSDISNLNIAFNTLCQMVTFHGPMVSSNMLEHYDDYTKSCFETTIHMGDELKFNNPVSEPLRIIVAGQASGPITGGNLALIINMLGTFYAPDFRGKILLIEDINESIPRIHRMLDQLRLLKVFDQVAGVLIGDFSGCDKEEHGRYDVNDFMKEYFSELFVPVISNLKVGHCHPTATIPLGMTCRIDTDSQSIVFRKK